jgi:nucleoside-diphosphate-sugar epimerase
MSWLSAGPPAKFVYTSSTSVYGQADGNWVTESSPTAPATQTGRILVETEELLLNEAGKAGFPAVVLRVAGIYGPGRAYWLEQVRSSQARVEGTGQRILNMIHRDDVVGSIITALGRGRPGQVYNAVDDEPVAQWNLLEWLSERLECPVASSMSEELAMMKKRGLTNKRVSNRKLKEELGYRMRFPSFREGYSAILNS